ncbi:hypothetical protein [Lutibacter sp.]|uniref:hypothetical protein n=1 Tax=Lutibacter sp. TaxID=1925666 RepID=UPI0025BC36B0|nr:hypothetical protein [Lutibacter sp.]MCF6169311.1 hypothetical protein [Lutibacter sp.]
MKKMIEINILIFLVGLFAVSCEKEAIKPDLNNIKKREFISSFETVDDFANFYITPQGYKGTTYHELSDSIVYSGTYSHKAWITGTNPPSTLLINNNHRGYPTIQLQNTVKGSFKTPCYITLWVWLDMELQENTSRGDDDWFSFATFTDAETDNWDRTVLVNLNHKGFVHLGHVPNQGEQSYIFQTTNLRFPQKEWVKLKIYLDFRNNGYAKVWQNGQLVSYANLHNIDNKLSQIHFGMYAPPQIANGVIYNDELKIIEVDGE